MTFRGFENHIEHLDYPILSDDLIVNYLDDKSTIEKQHYFFKKKRSGNLFLVKYKSIDEVDHNFIRANKSQVKKFFIKRFSSFLKRKKNLEFTCKNCCKHTRLRPYLSHKLDLSFFSDIGVCSVCNSIDEVFQSNVVYWFYSKNLNVIRGKHLSVSYLENLIPKPILSIDDIFSLSFIKSEINYNSLKLSDISYILNTNLSNVNKYYDEKKIETNLLYCEFETKMESLIKYFKQVLIFKDFSCSGYKYDNRIKKINHFISCNYKELQKVNNEQQNKILGFEYDYFNLINSCNKNLLYFVYKLGNRNYLILKQIKILKEKYKLYGEKYSEVFNYIILEENKNINFILKDRLAIYYNLLDKNKNNFIDSQHNLFAIKNFQIRTSALMNLFIDSNTDLTKKDKSLNSDDNVALHLIEYRLLLCKIESLENDTEILADSIKSHNINVLNDFSKPFSSLIDNYDLLVKYYNSHMKELRVLNSEIKNILYTSRDLIKTMEEHKSYKDLVNSIPIITAARDCLIRANNEINIKLINKPISTEAIEPVFKEVDTEDHLRPIKSFVDKVPRVLYITFFAILFFILIHEYKKYSEFISEKNNSEKIEAIIIDKIIIDKIFYKKLIIYKNINGHIFAIYDADKFWDKVKIDDHVTVFYIQNMKEKVRNINFVDVVKHDNLYDFDTINNVYYSKRNLETKQTTATILSKVPSNHGFLITYLNHETKQICYINDGLKFWDKVKVGDNAAIFYTQRFRNDVVEWLDIKKINN